MRNLSLIFNIILLAMIGILFYWHFSSGEKNAVAVTQPISKTDSFKTGFRIAYFDEDSLTESFEIIKNVRSELSKEEDKIRNENARLQKMYADRYNQYQNQQMSQVQSDAAKNDLMQLTEQIKGQQQLMDQKYQDLYMRKQQEVRTYIEDFLKKYNKDKGYTYIFKNVPDFIFYKDSTYNITGDMIKGLNAMYPKKK
jgi:outer membrane protein